LLQVHRENPIPAPASQCPPHPTGKKYERSGRTALAMEEKKKEKGKTAGKIMEKKKTYLATCKQKHFLS
jgi:hypothetical protein